jgi:hypothetical protein
MDLGTRIEEIDGRAQDVAELVEKAMSKQDVHETKLGSLGFILRNKDDDERFGGIA